MWRQFADLEARFESPRLVLSSPLTTCSDAPPMKRKDSFTQLANFAAKHELDLAPYYEARRQLQIALGPEFARIDTLFARELLSRLRFNRDVIKAVSLAWKALLGKGWLSATTVVDA